MRQAFAACTEQRADRKEKEENRKMALPEPAVPQLMAATG